MRVHLVHVTACAGRGDPVPLHDPVAWPRAPRKGRLRARRGPVDTDTADLQDRATWRRP